MATTSGKVAKKTAESSPGSYQEPTLTWKSIYTHTFTHTHSDSHRQRQNWLYSQKCKKNAYITNVLLQLEMHLLFKNHEAKLILMHLASERNKIIWPWFSTNEVSPHPRNIKFESIWKIFSELKFPLLFFYQLSRLLEIPSVLQTNLKVYNGKRIR